MSSRGRTVASWVPSLVVVPLAMVGAFAVSQPEEPFPELSALFPSDPGTTWVYAVSGGDGPSGTHTKVVRGRVGLVDETGLVEAVQVSSDYTDYPGSGPRSSSTYLGPVGDRLLQFSLRLDARETRLDPPAPAYELPVVVGTTWTYDGLLGGDRSIHYEVTLEEVTEVEVGGHTFSGCAHYVNQFDLTFADGTEIDHEVNEEWTCPGYGTVRSVATIEAQGSVVVEELVAFHGVDRSWRAAAPPDVREPSDPPLGATAGLDAARSNAVPDGETSSRLAWSDARDQRFLFGPVTDGEVMVLGDVTGDVAATGVALGEVRWRLSLPGPIVVQPVIVGPLTLVGDADKNLVAVETDTGAVRWVHHFDDVVSAPPTALGDSLLVASDDRRVTALALADGEVRWSELRSAPTRHAPARVDDLWVVADDGGEVTAYAEDGTTRWSAALEEALVVGPAVASGRVVLSDDTGIIYAFAVSDGDLLWEARPRGYPSEAFAVLDQTLVAVLDATRVQAFDLTDGTQRWVRSGNGFDSAPVVVGDQVVQITGPGEVIVRDLATGAVADRWQVPPPEADSRIDSDIDPALVGDALVFGAAVSGAESTAVSWAYPVTGEPAADHVDGVVLTTGDVRTLGTSPGGPPVVMGERFFTPGSDSALYAHDGPGPVRTVHTSTGAQPAAAVADDLLVAQQDEKFVAYPLVGGQPLWSTPAQPATPGVSPAIGEDAVFLPQYAVGLSAVDLDGSPRWDVAISSAFGPTTPLPLPGGDVIYGSGGMTRFDGRTGKTVWSDPDAQSPGQLALADGVVYADVIRAAAPSGLVAYDVRTGEQRWTHELTDPLFGGGPASEDGVVVDVDAQGHAFALDADDGSELWSIRLATAPGGRPVVIDGRVYLLELGRTEDLFARDFRLSVHDLRTGRFLASYEPTTTPFVSLPVLASTPDGRVVVPIGTDFGSLLVMEPVS